MKFTGFASLLLEESIRLLDWLTPIGKYMGFGNPTIIFALSSLLCSSVCGATETESAQFASNKCSTFLTASAKSSDVIQMNEWLRKIAAESAKLNGPLTYPRIQINEYGELWDHHHFVLTYSQAELDNRRIYFELGNAFLGNSKTPISTSSLRQRLALGFFRHAFGSSLWMYVMTCDGEIYLSPEGIDIKHSSFEGANCISGAGWMKIENGQVVYLDNNSGHYHPKPFTVALVLFQLARQGVDVSSIDFTLIGLKKNL